jgi:hypothetical protein
MTRWYFDDFLTAAWFHYHEGIEYEQDTFFGNTTDVEIAADAEGLGIIIRPRGRYYLTRESVERLTRTKEHWPEKMWPKEEGKDDEETST